VGSKFGISKSGLHLSLSLGEAQAYLNALKAGDEGAGQSVAGNAFNNALPLVTAGDIAIDENDKTQVAQRAALSKAIALEISAHHGGAQLAGGAVGGITGFVAPELAFKNLGVVGKLGKALNEVGLAKTTATGIDAVSKAATIALRAESDQLKANPQSQEMLDHLVGAAARAFAMATSMGVGGAVESGLGEAAAGLRPVPRAVAGGVASAAGTTAMGAMPQALEGRDPMDMSGGEFGANAGVGLAMNLMGLKARGEGTFQQAWKTRDGFIDALTAYDRMVYDGVGAPPGVSDLMAREASLRQQLVAAKSPEAQDPPKAQLLQNLAQQNDALSAGAASPNATHTAEAGVGAGQANGNPAGATSGNGGQTVPGGANPSKAGAAGAPQAPQAQGGGGDADGGKSQTPGLLRDFFPRSQDGKPIFQAVTAAARRPRMKLGAMRGV
jgi:hypothetical protein